MFSALAYDAANLVLQALEKSAKTGAILQKAIADSDFEGLTGHSHLIRHIYLRSLY